MGKTEATEMNARMLIFALHKHDGVPGVAKLPGLWYRKLPSNWEMWVNGHMEPLVTTNGVTVHPGDCFAECNGWPAGSFSLIHGEGGFVNNSYPAFCEALREAANGQNKPEEPTNGNS